jgi:hypothetical protein
MDLSDDDVLSESSSSSLEIVEEKYGKESNFIMG